MKPTIFDFNGTLFWDSDFHDKAWNEFSLKHTGNSIPADDMKQHIHGKINRDILFYVFGEYPAEELIEKFAIEKEAAYRELIVSDDGLKELAPGAEEYLAFLKEKNVPITIATSSNKANVDFFFEHLKLDRWFDYNLVIMEENTRKPKPEPDIFLQAAEKLQQKPENCTVIEDSYSGIVAAQNAGIGEIIFMQNNSPINIEKIEQMIHRSIRNFHELMP